MSEMMTSSRHYAASIWCNIHAISSLGALARRQASAIIVFPIANYCEKESIREQFGRLAGSLQKVDAINDEAIGVNLEPYSFLTRRADAKSANRTFMLRFEAWLETIKEDDDRVRFFFPITRLWQ